MGIEDSEDRLLTVNEVAERLRVHPITVRRHIKAGRLRALRVGRSVRVRESDVESSLRAEPDEQSSPATAALIRQARQVLQHISPATLPHRWPPTKEEVARRKKVVAAMLERRAKMKPLRITTAELVRAARRDLEDRYDRTSGASSRRIRRGKMASDRRAPYDRS